VEEGMVEAGEAIERIYRDQNKVTVADINRLYLNGGDDIALLRRALQVEALPDGYRDYLRQELQSLER
jgi:MOSC domain-containing protein YiiM